MFEERGKAGGLTLEIINLSAATAEYTRGGDKGLQACTIYTQR